MNTELIYSAKQGTEDRRCSAKTSEREHPHTVVISSLFFYFFFYLRVDFLLVPRTLMHKLLSSTPHWISHPMSMCAHFFYKK